jgi:hypothetical protein
MFYLSAFAEEEKLADLKRRFFAPAQTGCHDAWSPLLSAGCFPELGNPAMALFPKAIATAVRLRPSPGRHSCECPSVVDPRQYRPKSRLMRIKAD